MSITRRHVVTGAAAGLAAAALPRAAHGQSLEIVVGTWGGEYGALLRSEIDEARMKPLGITVSQDISSNDPRRTKLIAERGAERSSMDVACFNDLDSFALVEHNVLEAVPVDAVPSLSDVLPFLRKPNSIPHIYSAFVVVYNPNKIDVPPKGYSDLFDPKYAGRVGFSDSLYLYNMAAMNVAAGGQADDFAPGRKALLDLRKAEAKVYPSHEALSAALKTEEVWISVMWLARAYLWKKADVPVAWAVPDEGAFPLVFEAGVPRNSANKELAWKYLEAMLDPKAQIAFSEKIGYLPTVSDTQLPEELARQISLSEAQQAKLRWLDYAFVQKERGAMLDFWNKEFKA